MTCAKAITLALAQRAVAGIKVRQPLSSLVYTPRREVTVEHTDFLQEILKEEVNVKQVKLQPHSSGQQATAVLDLEITPEFRQEGLMREVVRNVQQARKQAGLEVDDRIELRLETADEELATLLQKNTHLTDIIKQETLAISLNNTEQSDFTATAKIDGTELTIGVTKS